MRTHTSAKEVARYLVWLSAHECEDDPDYLTPLKLQKLLYYVQGWTLAEREEPMFFERIEAWREGPVVPEVIKEFGKSLKAPIPASKGEDCKGLHESDKAMIRAVWDAYKHLSGFGLSNLTHAERPYMDVYRPDANGRCQAVIDTEQIKLDFRTRIHEREKRWAASRDRRHLAARKNTRALTGQDSI